MIGRSEVTCAVVPAPTRKDRRNIRVFRMVISFRGSRLLNVASEKRGRGENRRKKVVKGLALVESILQGLKLAGPFLFRAVIEGVSSKRTGSAIRDLPSAIEQLSDVRGSVQCHSRDTGGPHYRGGVGHYAWKNVRKCIGHIVNRRSRRGRCRVLRSVNAAPVVVQGDDSEWIETTVAEKAAARIALVCDLDRTALHRHGGRQCAWRRILHGRSAQQVVIDPQPAVDLVVTRVLLARGGQKGWLRQHARVVGVACRCHCLKRGPSGGRQAARGRHGLVGVNAPRQEQRVALAAPQNVGQEHLL